MPPSDTYTILSVFTIALFLQYLTPLIRKELPGIQGGLVSAVAILLLISPFLRAIMMKKNHSEEFQQLWSDSKYNRGPLVSLIVLRVALCIGIVMFVISSLVNVAGRPPARDRHCGHPILHLFQTVKKILHTTGTPFPA